MSHEQETADVEAGTSPKKLSAVGGFVGTVLGSRRGPAGAVAGGFLGGTLGYLTGASLRGSPATDTAAVETEPVAIDVADPDEEGAENGETAESGDAEESGGTGEDDEN